MKVPLRYERCEQCGKTWNVSTFARPYAGVYVCPICAGKNQRYTGMREKRNMPCGKGDEAKMRDYQPKKQNPYHLPHTLYRRVLALVRDYPRMVQVREAIIYESPENAGAATAWGDRRKTRRCGLRRFQTIFAPLSGHWINFRASTGRACWIMCCAA